MAEQGLIQAEEKEDDAEAEIELEETDETEFFNREMGDVEGNDGEDDSPADEGGKSVEESFFKKVLESHLS